MTRRVWAIALALWAAMTLVAGAAPSPRPSHGRAYLDYADYYLRRYAHPKPTADPYRYFHFYGYYRTHYAKAPKGLDRSDPYYYFRHYQAPTSDRYHDALHPPSAMLGQALRYWHFQKPTEQASLDRPPRGR
jgi:hypothetical protein